MDFEKPDLSLKYPGYFLAIAFAGVVISLFASANLRTFSSFLVTFSIGTALSLAISYSITARASNKLKSILIISVLIISSFAVLFTAQGRLGCVAWQAHSAQNPLTNQCEAIVYGGCGPKPDPWYYKDQCSPEPKQAMCERLQNSNREDADKLEYSLCTNYPELVLSKTEYDEENEELTLEVVESEYSFSNTKNLSLVNDRNGDFEIKNGAKVYNTSVLLGRGQKSVFNNSINQGDAFTIVDDGHDLDNDGVNGVDYREGETSFYQIYYWNKGERGTIAHIDLNYNGEFEYGQRFPD